MTATPAPSMPSAVTIAVKNPAVLMAVTTATAPMIASSAMKALTIWNTLVSAPGDNAWSNENRRAVRESFSRAGTRA